MTDRRLPSPPDTSLGFEAGAGALALRPRPPRRLAGRAWWIAAAVSVRGCSRVLGPKATLGPGAIVRGRSLYNDVISATNDEQIHSDPDSPGREMSWLFQLYGTAVPAMTSYFGRDGRSSANPVMALT